MEVEKRGAKGGFFQLFDWNSKSRKKLFSSKSEVPESSNQGKENFYSSAISRHQQGLENDFALGARGHNDYHYASSSNGDSEYGTKAPGVVARLMGLDSLPKSAINEPFVTPYVEPHSFRDCGYIRAAPVFQSEHDIVIFESVRNKLDGLTRNPLELRLQKVQNRQLERFQTEVLPPKSAKPISVAHNRLLSPIKSPGFIPPKNAAYIIEAAAKIMEQSPRSTSKGKFPSIGSSSLPYRVRDMKEKMDAAERSSQLVDSSRKDKEPSSSKLVKKQLSAKSQRRSEGSYLYKGPEELKRTGSQRSKSKEKPVSLAVQAKSNIPRKDGQTSVSKQKECSGIKSSSVSRNYIPNTQRKVEKQSLSRRPPEALRPNQQKQNCASTKDREIAEPSFSHSKDVKDSNLSNNYTYGRTNKTVNKIILQNEVTSKKTNLVAAELGKELSSSRTKTISKNRLPINGNNQSDRIVSQKAEMMKDEKSTCNAAFDGDSKWDMIDKKNSLDVVSFTFTSPIKKSGARSNSVGKFLDMNGSSFPDHDPRVLESDLSSSVMSSLGFNVAGGDSLSVLLEQKLKELASRVELSQHEHSEVGTSTSTNSYGHIPTVNSVNPLPHDDVCKSKQENQHASDGSCVDQMWFKSEKQNKGVEYMENDGNSSTIEYQGRDFLQGSGSASSLPSYSGASSYSVDVERSSSNEGSMQCLSLESYEGTNWSSAKKSQSAEGDLEISDTASSLSHATTSETFTPSSYVTDSKDSSYWELLYIGEVLSSGALMLEDFALGKSHKVIAPDLFDQLETRKTGQNKDMEENFVLERKVLFHCVSECLEFRSGRLLAGNYSFWARQSVLLQKKQWLAEELYREISSWTNNEELMVDELVEKDMSSKNGKWVDFEIEAFEEGVEIEERILTSLVDELIDDFLL